MNINMNGKNRAGDKKHQDRRNIGSLALRRFLCIAVSAAFCAAVIFVSGCSSDSSGAGSASIIASASEKAASPENTVTVCARGSSYAVPDMAELRFGIRTQAATASEAQKNNSKDVNSVINVLKKNGINKEDIQTTWYDVTPQYDWNTGNGNTITGYSVTSSLSVKNVKIDDAGKLITACTEAGASEFNGVNYSCTEYDKFYGEAMKEAVAASKEKADLLAKAAGRTLGEVASITEGYQDTTYAANTKSLSAMDSTGSLEENATGASILPGQAEITATVTVTYFLK